MCLVKSRLVTVFCYTGYWGENCSAVCPVGAITPCNGRGVCDLKKQENVHVITTGKVLKTVRRVRLAGKERSVMWCQQLRVMHLLLD